jgi:hypothetical protein
VLVASPRGARGDFECEETLRLRLPDLDPVMAVHPNLSIPINVMFGDSVDALGVFATEKRKEK